MEFRQLETFLKVAELKSFSKAAQAIFLTQPTVSEHIRQLEEELRTKLFLRTKREAVLTPSGILFEKQARKLLSLRKQIILEMSRFSESAEGELTIGASSIPGEYILPPLISSFQKKFPKIKIELAIADSKKATEWVLERKCEIAFTGSPPHTKLLRVTPFSSDRIVAVTHANHPLAQESSLFLKDLQNVPLVLREPGSGTRKAVETALSEKGLSWKSFQIGLTVSSATAAIQAVLNGPFFSFLSTKSIASLLNSHQLVVLQVNDFQPIERNFYLIQGRKELLSPMAQHFLTHITSPGKVSPP